MLGRSKSRYFLSLFPFVFRHLRNEILGSKFPIQTVFPKDFHSRMKTLGVLSLLEISRMLKLNFYFSRKSDLIII